MGKALAELGYPRESMVLSTKVYMGLTEGVNTKETLNRKYLMHAIDGCLERFGQDFVDLLFCHRPDPETPIEETVWAMSDIITSGKALYWGTSEWPADEIRAAWDIAERHHLHKPVVEQPQYNLFERRKVEQEYARLYDDIGLGLTIWSPLASGLLTGKYLDGVPDDSRAALPGYEWLKERLTDPALNAKAKELKVVADELGCTMSQLALAWCAANPHVSTVITGASTVAQVEENMGALDVLATLDDEMRDRGSQRRRTRLSGRMKVVVLFESLTGNTKRAAELIGGALHEKGVEVHVRPITAFDYGEVAAADVVVVGTWVDGFIVAGHRPGRAGRLLKLPVLDRKKVAAYVTYAINPGKALKKTVRVLEGRGADVIASAQLKRNHLEEQVGPFVAELLELVPA